MDNQTASAFYNTGMAFTSQSKYDRGYCRLFEKAIQLDPMDASTYFNLGIAFSRKEDTTTLSLRIDSDRTKFQ